jgi:hypothetical protein
MVKSTDPRSGTYHLESHPSNPADRLYVRNFDNCDQSKWVDGNVAVSAKVVPGDFVKFSYWMKRTGAGGSPTTDSNLWFYAADNETLISLEASGNQSIGPSYSQYSIEAFTPSGAEYVYAVVWPISFGMDAGSVLRADDLALQVSK